MDEKKFIATLIFLVVYKKLQPFNLTKKQIPTMKPILKNRAELIPLYAHYYQTLCNTQPTLATRLASGLMKTVDFSALIPAYRVILLDAFGVLNLGKKPIAGAPEQIEYLKKTGKPFLVVSNNASQSHERLEKNFKNMGFDIQKKDIISSGMAVKPTLLKSPHQGQPYYLVGTADSIQSYAPDPERLMVNHPSKSQQETEWMKARYILLCSNRDYYSGPQQEQVERLLAEKKVPVIMANPDLIAPDTDGVSVVAGYTASEWVKRFGVTVHGVGKPFSPVFELARQRFPDVQPKEFLMVGDTLDTDILGGAAQGFSTCLTLSGIYASQKESLTSLCDIRNIRPDYVVADIAS